MEITNPRRFVVFCLVVLLLPTIIVFVWLTLRHSSPAIPEAVQASPTVLAAKAPAPLVITVSGEDEEGARLFFSCRLAGCTNIAVPDSHPNVDTPLVRARDSFMSPNGRYVAYWLDNIADPHQQLTEVWVYDTQEKHTHLVAEHIFVPDVRSELRWNGSSTLLWFTGNTAPRQQPEKIELITVTVAPPNVAARSLPNEEIVDISPGGGRLFLAHQVPRSLARRIVFLRFVDEETQLYGVADGGGFAFWRQATTVASLAGRLSFQQLPGGLKNIRVQTVEFDSAAQGEDAGIPVFEDAELTAFLENHGGEITALPEVQIQRIVMTKQPNTLYVDYMNAAGEPKRILVTIKDIIHPEWSVRAHYERPGGQWRRVAGGSESDPEAVRLYEWEEALSQWILKGSM